MQGSGKVFTLGDVADILDNALDTGISIVDALSKLSDCADQGILNREICFQQLELLKKTPPSSVRRSNQANRRVADPTNQQHSSDRQLSKIQSKLGGIKSIVVRSSSNQLAFSGLEAEKGKTKRSRFMKKSLRRKPLKLKIEKVGYNSASYCSSDGYSYDTQSSDGSVTEESTTKTRLPDCQDYKESTSHLRQSFSRALIYRAQVADNADVSSEVSPSSSPVDKIRETIPTSKIYPGSLNLSPASIKDNHAFFEEYYTLTGNSVREEKTSSQSLTTAVKLRPETFVLGEETSADVAAMKGLPIIDALDDLCRVADELLNVCHEAQQHKPFTDTSTLFEDDEFLSLEARCSIEDSSFECKVGNNKKELTSSLSTCNESSVKSMASLERERYVNQLPQGQDKWTQTVIETKNLTLPELKNAHQVNETNHDSFRSTNSFADIDSSKYHSLRGEKNQDSSVEYSETRQTYIVSSEHLKHRHGVGQSSPQDITTKSAIPPSPLPRDNKMCKGTVTSQGTQFDGLVGDAPLVCDIVEHTVKAYRPSTFIISPENATKVDRSSLSQDNVRVTSPTGIRETYVITPKLKEDMPRDRHQTASPSSDVRTQQVISMRYKDRTNVVSDEGSHTSNMEAPVSQILSRPDECTVLHASGKRDMEYNAEDSEAFQKLGSLYSYMSRSLTKLNEMTKLCDTKPDLCSSISETGRPVDVSIEDLVPYSEFGHPVDENSVKSLGDYITSHFSQSGASVDVDVQGEIFHVDQSLMHMQETDLLDGIDYRDIVPEKSVEKLKINLFPLPVAEKISKGMVKGASSSWMVDSKALLGKNERQSAFVKYDKSSCTSMEIDVSDVKPEESKEQLIERIPLNSLQGQLTTSSLHLGDSHFKASVTDKTTETNCNSRILTSGTCGDITSLQRVSHKEQSSLKERQPEVPKGGHMTIGQGYIVQGKITQNATANEEYYAQDRKQSEHKVKLDIVKKEDKAVTRKLKETVTDDHTIAKMPEVDISKLRGLRSVSNVSDYFTSINEKARVIESREKKKGPHILQRRAKQFRVPAKHVKTVVASGERESVSSTKRRSRWSKLHQESYEYVGERQKNAESVHAVDDMIFYLQGGKDQDRPWKLSDSVFQFEELVHDKQYQGIQRGSLRTEGNQGSRQSTKKKVSESSRNPSEIAKDNGMVKSRKVAHHSSSIGEERRRSRERPKWLRGDLSAKQWQEIIESCKLFIASDNKGDVERHDEASQEYSLEALSLEEELRERKRNRKKWKTPKRSHSDPRPMFDSKANIGLSRSSTFVIDHGDKASQDTIVSKSKSASEKLVSDVKQNGSAELRSDELYMSSPVLDSLLSDERDSAVSSPFSSTASLKSYKIFNHSPVVTELPFRDQDHYLTMYHGKDSLNDVAENRINILCTDTGVSRTDVIKHELNALRLKTAPDSVPRLQSRKTECPSSSSNDSRYCYNEKKDYREITPDFMPQLQSRKSECSSSSSTDSRYCCSEKNDYRETERISGGIKESAVTVSARGISGICSQDSPPFSGAINLHASDIFSSGTKQFSSESTSPARYVNISGGRNIKPTEDYIVRTWGNSRVLESNDHQGQRTCEKHVSISHLETCEVDRNVAEASEHNRNQLGSNVKKSSGGNAIFSNSLSSTEVKPVLSQKVVDDDDDYELHKMSHIEETMHVKDQKTVGEESSFEVRSSLSSFFIPIPRRKKEGTELTNKDSKPLSASAPATCRPSTYVISKFTDSIHSDGMSFNSKVKEKTVHSHSSLHQSAQGIITRDDSGKDCNVHGEVSDQKNPEVGFSGQTHSLDSLRNVKSSYDGTIAKTNTSIISKRSTYVLQTAKEIHKLDISKPCTPIKTSTSTGNRNVKSGCSKDASKDEVDNGDDKEDKNLGSRLASLRMQLEERRKHIEKEKKKMVEKWNEERMKSAHNAFWLMIGKDKQKEVEREARSEQKRERKFSNEGSSKGRKVWDLYVPKDEPLEADNECSPKEESAAKKKGLMFFPLHESKSTTPKSLDFKQGLHALNSPPMECSTPLSPPANIQKIQQLPGKPASDAVQREVKSSSTEIVKQSTTSHSRVTARSSLAHFELETRSEAVSDSLPERGQSLSVFRASNVPKDKMAAENGDSPQPSFPQSNSVEDNAISAYQKSTSSFVRTSSQAMDAASQQQHDRVLLPHDQDLPIEGLPEPKTRSEAYSETCLTEKTQEQEQLAINETAKFQVISGGDDHLSPTLLDRINDHVIATPTFDQTPRVHESETSDRVLSVETSHLVTEHRKMSLREQCTVATYAERSEVVTVPSSTPDDRSEPVLPVPPVQVSVKSSPVIPLETHTSDQETVLRSSSETYFVSGPSIASESNRKGAAWVVPDDMPMEVDVVSAFERQPEEPEKEKTVRRRSGGVALDIALSDGPSSSNDGTHVTPNDGLALNGMTPDQLKKRERFIQNRLRQQQEQKAKREADMEKRRRIEEKKKERKEILERKEEEGRDRLRKKRQLEEELARRKAEEEETVRKREEQMWRLRHFTSNKEEVEVRHTVDRFHPIGHTSSSHSGSTGHIHSPEEEFAAGLGSATFREYNGPPVYVKPSGKSNRKIIVNAISHCCLSGEVNKDAKEKCLQVLSTSDASHFLVLFRDGLKFRGLYSYAPENDTVTKLYGLGPRHITTKMIEKLYKYNSGGKEFTEIHAKSFSIQVDGLTIKKEYWISNKQGVSKTNTNLKKAPVKQSGKKL